MAIKWTPKIQFPTDSNFVNRISGAVFGPSNNSNNPMITLTLEVVNPSEVEVGNDKVNIAGVETKMYFVTQFSEKNASGQIEINSEKTENGRKRVRELWTMLGLDPETINWDNIDVKPLIGKLVLTQMSPDVDPQRKNPTAAQIEEAKKKGIRAEGDVQKHPISGKPLINYWPKVREIFGLAPDQTGASAQY